MTQVCPNCGWRRPDRYCSRCGQNDRDYVRTLWAVVNEFCRETLGIDSRLFRTLKSLLFKPGHLSAEFSGNRRAAYMSPVRIYLVASFAFFLILSITARGSLANLRLSDDDETEAVEAGETADAEADAVADSARAESALAVADSVLGAVDSLLAERGISLEALVGGALADSLLASRARAGATILPAAAEAAEPAVAGEPVGVTVPPERLEAFKAGLSPVRRLKVDDILGRPDESVGKQAIRGLASAELDGDMPGWVDWLARYGTGLAIDVFHDPDDFLQQAIGNLPIAMFFLLPVFAMILAVCYFRRKRFFVEHLVFGMHIHTFAFLMLAAALLVPGEATGNWVKLFLVVVSPFYVLIAIRRFYGEGWGWTLVKGFVVWSLYSFVLFPGLALAFLIRP